MAEKKITVLLTRDQFVAVQNTVRGELDSLTEHDWASGLFADLAAAQKALNEAWKKAS